MDNHIFNPPAYHPNPENTRYNPKTFAALPRTQAVVSVRNLQLPSGAIAPNIWHETKEQPALTSVSIWLRDSFTSAASQDALDDSTVHYGELSKRVRAACATDEGQRSPLDAVFQAAEHMARKPKSDGDKFVATRIAAKLKLPKASAFGEELSMNEVRIYDKAGKKTEWFYTFACKNLKIPTLIGVNAYERKGRQPVVVDFALDFCDEDSSLAKEMEALFPLERELVSIIEKTDFETLETLVEHTLRELRPVLESRSIRPWVVHLRFEKPCAVPFADAPVIEIHQRWENEGADI